ncbi:MAG: Ppx/GppA family phosphatase [Ignavibacteria bacterium]|nr:Ppx/GppA family phosphatase [Ignavibacteria bacterium]
MIEQSNFLAAVDIGTNSFHLIVVKVEGDTGFTIIDREKEVIRLSEGSKGDIKIITPEAMNRGITTLKKFKGLAESHNAKLRAMATSAVRESLNKEEFISKVYNETGIEVEVISGYEEARLIYLGILNALPVYEKKTLAIDIGGGSTEFVLGEKEKILYSNSLKLGAVRLSNKFFPDYEIKKKNTDECKKWIEGELYPVVRSLREQKIDIATGSSGTIMTAALISLSKKKKKDYSGNILNNYVFTYQDLQEVYDEVFKIKSAQKRSKILGLDEQRSDIFPAGLLILKTIFEQLNIKEITISGYALREGIIIDSLYKYHSNEVKPKLNKIRLESVKRLAKNCHYEKKHSDHIAFLSLRLFDQLQNFHKLDNDCREYLEAAAILHDIGFYISHNQHHKHSYYIIRNSELLGFTNNEIEIIANIARYHRKSHPKESHSAYNSLNPKNKQIVNKLSAILRICDSLDRTHQQVIDDIIVAKISGNMIKLEIVYKGNYPEIEEWNFQRRKLLFEETFNTGISLLKN